MRPQFWSFPMKPVRVQEGILATLDPAKYSMERKYDGHRAIVRIDGGVRMWTRDMREIPVPRNLELELGSLGIPSETVLDGEIWNPTKRGDWKSSTSVACCLALWDVTWFEGASLADAPLRDRREVLHRLIGAGTEGVRAAEVEALSLAKVVEIREDAVAFRQENAIRSGYVHGLVVKRDASPRRDHATRCKEHPDWMKILFPGMKGWEPA